MRASQMATFGREVLCFTERGKTGVPVGSAFSGRSLILLRAYLNQLGVTLTGDAYIFAMGVVTALLRHGN